MFLAIFIIIAITMDDGITKKNAPNCRSKRQFIFNLLRNIKLYNFSSLAKKPLCIDRILQRERRPPGVNSPPVLLTDGEDPNQVNRDCRLHHYTQVDVTACIDELSYRRAKHKEPVHIAFIGESIIRHQFMSFLRVHLIIAAVLNWWPQNSIIKCKHYVMCTVDSGLRFTNEKIGNAERCLFLSRRSKRYQWDIESATVLLLATIG